MLFSSVWRTKQLNNIKLKKILILFLIFISCNGEDIKPRIGIAGIWIEASTFSPISSTEKNFNIKYSSEIFLIIHFLTIVI